MKFYCQFSAESASEGALNKLMLLFPWHIIVHISLSRSFCLRLSSVVVVVTVDSERSKSHDVFELGVQCGWSAVMFRCIIQRCCR